jgi:hypothetical protein
MHVFVFPLVLQQKAQQYGDTALRLVVIELLRIYRKPRGWALLAGRGFSKAGIYANLPGHLGN